MNLIYRGMLTRYLPVPHPPLRVQGASARRVRTTLLAARRRQTGCIKSFGPFGATSLVFKALKAYCPFGDNERHTVARRLLRCAVQAHLLKLKSKKACLLRCAKQANALKPKSKRPMATSLGLKSF